MRRLTASALGLLLLAAAPPARAEAPGPMTGAALHDALRTPPGSAGRQRAAVYLEALQPGVPRCPGPPLKPHEREARVFDHLDRLSPAARQGEAAPLVRDALRC